MKSVSMRSSERALRLLTCLKVTCCILRRAVGDGQTVGKRGQKQYCEDRERDTERVDHDVLSRAMSRPSTERNECPGDGSFYAASEI